MSSKTVVVLFALLVALSSLSDFAQRLYFHNVTPANATPPSFGSASDNVLPLLPTASSVVVGTSDTTVVSTSTGRQFLEIGNIGTTSQALYCNFGDRPAVLYQGLTIQASTTKSFNLDNLYRGAIHCIAPVKQATVSVADF